MLAHLALEIESPPATYHMGCHLPVLAELFGFHQLLRHSLSSLRKQKRPQRAAIEYRFQLAPPPKSQMLTPGVNSPSYAPWLEQWPCLEAVENNFLRNDFARTKHAGCWYIWYHKHHQKHAICQVMC